MKYISLFSGIGGFDLAADRAGMKCMAQVEINRDCQQVLGTHWPKVKRFKDVARFTRRSTKSVCGAIFAGWPCQGNSVAGLRGGMADGRSGLWSEVVRVLAEFTPQYFVGENVPGLLSVCGCRVCAALKAFRALHDERERQHNKFARSCECARCADAGRVLQAHSGRDYFGVLADLAQLGYGFAYRVLDAQYFGVPQRRRRVFVVGCLGDWRRAAEILFERDCLPWNPPPSREAQPDIAGTLDAGAGVRRGAGQNPGSLTPVSALTGSLGNGGACAGRAQAGHIVPSGPWWDGSDTAPCLDASVIGKQQMMPEKGRFAAVLTPQVASTLTAGMATGSGVNPPGRRREDDFNLVATNIGPGANQESKITVAYGISSANSCEKERHAREIERARCLDTTGGFSPGQGGTVVVPIDMRQASRGATMTNNRANGSSGGAPGTGIGEAGEPSPTIAGSHVPAIAFQCHGSNVGPMGTLRAGNGNESGGVSFIASDYKTGDFAAADLSRPLTTSADRSRAAPVVVTQHGGSGPKGAGGGDPCQSLNAGSTPAAAISFQTRIARNGRGQPKEITDALTSCEGGTHADSKPHVAYSGGVRRLTPKECERLMGLPDDWTRWGPDDKEISDSARYRMCGNSIAVPCAEWIMRRIITQQALFPERET